MASPRTKNQVPRWIQNPYPHVEHVLISFPREHVLLVVLNRPEHMNCLPFGTVMELNVLWKWYDLEPELRCAVLTGAGSKSFSTGMDLKEMLHSLQTNDIHRDFPSGGSAGLSNRAGKKPIIVACNGYAHGGGFEAILNADVIFASPNATFRLPEVLRGLSALAGALPRCMLLFGNHRTMDLVLTGRTMSVEEAHNWGLVKEIVPQDKLLERALDYADEIAALSPDSIIITRLAAREAWETGVSRATTRGQEMWAEALLRSKNVTEGLAAFREKRKPRWFPSHL
ncbi:carnitinyl-CoA dehydratase [Colletotrichum tofieldiae]|uniref:Carnitinyl-CoA dehydratase n=1 Tax=Colletotrichum tofieldiae TaxID=708197 RepID=A0A161YB63_9PEZI|nr:carnitinyl-CoA dehydratase [Colletotrichum tofieldiae]